MTMENPTPESPLPQGLGGYLRRFLFGKPRNLHDPTLAHKISLIAFFAWVGLGADGLSSSCYGPEEAFRALGPGHTYLAFLLAIATAATVFIISYAYTKIIEIFPSGGGGYLVATKLLGKHAGVVSGCALLIDYVLTIAVSVASGGDAVFSLLPVSWQDYKLPVVFGMVFFLMVMNLRGVKESVTVLMPIFLVFVATHIVLLIAGLCSHLFALGQVTSSFTADLHKDFQNLGLLGTFLIFLRAYSMGSGTYTGIEAVSNGLAIMREPKVETGKRTMLYIAASLAFTAGGLFLCYMLFDVRPVEGRTLNAVLATELAGNLTFAGLPVGWGFVMVTIFSEAVLLLVAAQTGFLDGPRVMASMAADGWVPRRFATLSDRLTMQNGILLMGVAAGLVLWLSRGQVGFLLVLYSINVFLTFSLSQLAMVWHWLQTPRSQPGWVKNLLVNGVGLMLCAAILLVMLMEKFLEGGWVTVLITCGAITICISIRKHYANIVKYLRELDKLFSNVGQETHSAPPSVPEFDPEKSTAVLLVAQYGFLGIHAFYTLLRLFPKNFHNVVFLSVGMVDSEIFRDSKVVAELEARTQGSLDKYIDLAAQYGLPARGAFRIGTDIVQEVSQLCVETQQHYPRAVFIAGELTFDNPQWYHRLLHNETAYAIQRRIRSAGLPLVILPTLIKTKNA